MHRYRDSDEHHGAIACDAFLSIDDGVSHAIVLGRDGALTDIAYEPAGSVRTVRPVGRADGARDVAAFWSNTDEVRNAISVGAEGEVWHFRQKGEAEWTRSRRRDVADACRVAGYDLRHHGILLTGSGRITDEPFHGVTAAVQQAEFGPSATPAASLQAADEEPAIEVAVLPAALDIAALWADGENRFVIATDESGGITEIGYGDYQPATRRVLASIPGVVRVSACYVDDAETGRRVVALTRRGDVYACRYGSGPPRPGRPVTTGAFADVACFVSADGDVRVVLVSDDEVIEFALPEDA